MTLAKLQEQARALEIELCAKYKELGAEKRRYEAEEVMVCACYVQSASEGLARLLPPVAQVPRREMEAWKL